MQCCLTPDPPYASRTNRCDLPRISHDVHEDANERWARIGKRGALEMHAERTGPVPGLDVDVVQHLEVIADEADRHDEHVPHALLSQRLQFLEQIGADPRLLGAAGKKTSAARLLGLSRETMRYRLEKYGIG